MVHLEGLSNPIVADGESSESSEDMGKAVSKVSRFFASKKSEDHAAPTSSTAPTPTPDPAAVLTPASAPVPSAVLAPAPTSIVPAVSPRVPSLHSEVPASDSSQPGASRCGVPPQPSTTTPYPASSPYYPLATPRSPLRRSPRPASPSDISPARPAPKRLRGETARHLDYPIFNHDATISYVQSSKVIFIMKGVPGSGKTYMVQKIQEIYQSVPVVVCSADHYFMQDGEYQFEPEKLKEAHEFCQQQARDAAENKNIIVIDNTNVRNWENEILSAVGQRVSLYSIGFRASDPLGTGPRELAVRNQHDVPEDILRKKLKSYQPVQIMYYGWFLNEMDSENVLMKAKNWLYEAINVDQFAKDLIYRLNLSSPQDLFRIYSRDTYRDGGSILHCTAKFTGRGKVMGAAEYMDSAVVKSAMGKCFTLNIIGFIITPRTFGARLRLTTSQLELWGNDDNEKPPPVHQPTIVNSVDSTSHNTDDSAFGMQIPQSPCKLTTLEVSCEESSDRFHPTSGKGSRAHITLACAPGVKPVTTGFDTIRVVQREQEALMMPDDAVETYQLPGGVMRSYGEGLWTIYPDRVLQVSSMFSAFYV